jgi:hypothetical protein
MNTSFFIKRKGLHSNISQQQQHQQHQAPTASTKQQSDYNKNYCNR